jgi:UDP-N-acetylmuramate: L-alanyl-gamma-D-glutamyl-meso-diaminopimelate ligase
MKVHFIAIGGSAMHNLAIALHRKGYEVTGSDDEIAEPSLGRLRREGLLPKATGWFQERIHSGLDAVILGMHARADNPELLRAIELNLPVYSYPEYLYEQAKNKRRVVIGGSHGKTTITSMILHVLRFAGLDHDYMVGAQLEGFDCMVKLSEAPVAVYEGDEYLSSPTDRRPKFHLYRPHIALISGIAWDHINVFPTKEDYFRQFSAFIEVVEPGGTVIYNVDDPEVNRLRIESLRGDLQWIPYGTHAHRIEEGHVVLEPGNWPVQVFGSHNMQNLMGAKEVCHALGIGEEDFYRAMASFKGASRRLELVKQEGTHSVYRDFAHSPSKLRATVRAVREKNPDYHLTAVLELHTFSSLTKAYLAEYRGCMEGADRAMVYYSPATIAHKRLEPISEADVIAAFGFTGLEVYTDASAMELALANVPKEKSNLLLMSSGRLGG